MRMRLGFSVLLATALVVTGCGAEEEPDAAPKAPATASPTAPPGVDTDPPERPSGMTDSSTSAVEYATWFAQLVRFALESRNSRVVSAEAFDQGACSGCRSLATFIDELERSGFWQVSDDLDIGTLKASQRKDVVRVKGSFSYPRIRDLTVDGKVSRTIPTKPYGYYVDLSWNEERQGWQVRDFYFQPRA